jgi:hypothetical protein
VELLDTQRHKVCRGAEGKMTVPTTRPLLLLQQQSGILLLGTMSDESFFYLTSCQRGVLWRVVLHTARPRCVANSKLRALCKAEADCPCIKRGAWWFSRWNTVMWSYVSVDSGCTPIKWKVFISFTTPDSPTGGFALFFDLGFSLMSCTSNLINNENMFHHLSWQNFSVKRCTCLYVAPLLTSLLKYTDNSRLLLTHETELLHSLMPETWFSKWPFWV